jgi:hypothetical protein
MKVIVTLDFLDGTQNKTKECELEEVSSRLTFYLTQPGVVGVTVTRAKVLVGLMKGVEVMR